MTQAIDQATIEQIGTYDTEQRFRYLLKQAIARQELWILTDEHGSVMLNHEDEDCVPVWPHREFAEQWASDDWADCEPKAIDLKTWHQRWTPGLLDDQLSLVLFPDQEQGGVVLFPDEFDVELKKQAQKQRK